MTAISSHYTYRVTLSRKLFQLHTPSATDTEKNEKERKKERNWPRNAKCKSRTVTRRRQFSQPATKLLCGLQEQKTIVGFIFIRAIVGFYLSTPTPIGDGADSTAKFAAAAQPQRRCYWDTHIIIYDHHQRPHNRHWSRGLSVARPVPWGVCCGGGSGFVDERRLGGRRCRPYWDGRRGYATPDTGSRLGDQRPNTKHRFTASFLQPPVMSGGGGLEKGCWNSRPRLGVRLKRWFYKLADAVTTWQ